MRGQKLNRKYPTIKLNHSIKRKHEFQFTTQIVQWHQYQLFLLNFGHQIV